MSSSRTERRSIATRLVWLFTPAAALLLFCALAVLYWIVARHGLEEDRAVLADKLLALRAGLRSASGLEVLREEIKRARPGERSPFWVRLLDERGQTVAETPGMDQLLTPSAFKLQKEGVDIEPIDLRTGGKLFSLVSTQARMDQRIYLIQLAQDRTEDEAFTRQFGALVVAVMILGILASGAIAVRMAKSGLRPLDEMTHSLQRIGPQRLHERVVPAQWPRELQPVAVAFDEMLDRLEDSFTRLSQFSADIAHELRTPVANIRGEAEVALSRPRAPNEYQEVIGSIIAECERLSGIIDNLLFLARAEAAEAQVHRRTFNAREAIEKITAYYQLIAEEREVTVQYSGEGEIYADELLVERALSNLVDNALRFTPSGGTIEIAVTNQKDAMQISVRDTGSGIAAEHLPRVFDRFYRADPSRSSEGTGLGLALVKSIMDLHGGTAEAESTLGRGTTIRLRFPVRMRCTLT